MKKGLVVLTGTLLLASLVYAQEVNQNVQCTICFLEDRGTTTTTCESTQIRLDEASGFFYNLGQRLAQAGIKDWTLECKMGKKKVKIQGKLEEESLLEKN